MRVLFIAAFLVLSVVSLAACDTASPATPVPTAEATETPGPVFTAQASTDLVPTGTPASDSGGLAVSVVGAIISTPVETIAATATDEPTVLPPSPSATPVSSPSPEPALPIPTPSTVAATPASIPRNGPLTVTLADAGKTVEVKAGSGFLLALGEGWNWNVTVADPSIVSRQINIAVVRGAQGVYNAHKVGQTTLRAVGDPLCRATNPPCELPSRLVEITIVVT
jgi:hypothetical protein